MKLTAVDVVVDVIKSDYQLKNHALSEIGLKYLPKKGRSCQEEVEVKAGKSGSCYQVYDYAGVGEYVISWVTNTDMRVIHELLLAFDGEDYHVLRSWKDKE